MGTTFEKVVRFTSDAAAMEKILRLLQSLCQVIAVSFAGGKGVMGGIEFWLGLRVRFALGRRYFRFFNFLSHFSKAYEAFWVESLGLLQLLTVGKWTFMGGYLGLESLDTLNTLGIWHSPWAEELMLQANRFWFYALLCSIMINLLISWNIPPIPREAGPKPVKAGIKEKVPDPEEVEKWKKERSQVKRKLISDSADLLIPGHVVGWLPSSLSVVGWASAVSTLIGMQEIWERI